VHALIKTNVAATMVAHAILQIPFVSMEDALIDRFQESQPRQSCVGE
jgi:hypothetical protein